MRSDRERLSESDSTAEDAPGGAPGPEEADAEGPLSRRKRLWLQRRTLVQALLPAPLLALPARLSGDDPALPQDPETVIEATAEEIVPSAGRLERALEELDALEREVAESMEKVEARRRALAARADSFSRRRANPRHAVVVAVDLNSENNLYGGFGLDLSEGGVFVSTPWVLPLGTDVNLEIQLPGNERVQARGQVAWHRKKEASSAELPPGMGIRFVEVERRDVLIAFMRTRPPL